MTTLRDEEKLYNKVSNKPSKVSNKPSASITVFIASIHPLAQWILQTCCPLESETSQNRHKPDNTQTSTLAYQARLQSWRHRTDPWSRKPDRLGESTLSLESWLWPFETDRCCHRRRWSFDSTSIYHNDTVRAKWGRTRVRRSEIFCVSAPTKPYSECHDCVLTITNIQTWNRCDNPVYVQNLNIF